MHRVEFWMGMVKFLDSLDLVRSQGVRVRWVKIGAGPKWEELPDSLQRNLPHPTKFAAEWKMVAEFLDHPDYDDKGALALAQLRLVAEGVRDDRLRESATLLPL